MEGVRLVVTGVGIVGPLGRGREEFWDRTIAGERGLTSAEGVFSRSFGSIPVGRIPERPPVSEDIAEDPSRSDAGSGDPPPVLAMILAAASEALVQSGATSETVHPERAGAFLGTCQGDVQGRLASCAAGLAVRGARSRPETTRAPPSSAMNPHFTQGLVDALADLAGACGPRIAVSTACASGAHAIGLAADQLIAGRVDLAIAGGADELGLVSIAGFLSVGAVDKNPCSPFGSSRGLNVGEGAAFLVLERAADADRRQATVLAELLGYGTSADANHPTAPDPEGMGAELAVRRAFRSSGLGPDDVDYVNAHGTGTSANDEMERRLFARLFCDRPTAVPIGATKAATGHAFGGSAAMEAALSVLAVQRDVMPPTAGKDARDIELDLVGPLGRQLPVGVALSNSHAFGGNNASLFFGKSGRDRSLRPSTHLAEVVVTGIGAVGPPGVGRSAWEDGVLGGKTFLVPTETSIPGAGSGFVPMGGPPPLEPSGFASARLWRRMDALGRQSVLAVGLALEDAGALDLAGSDDVGVLVATDSGPFDTAAALERQIAAGTGPVHPVLFANSVMSSTSGHVCGVFGWRGPTATILSGWTSATNAVIHGSDLLRRGAAEAVMVVAGDASFPEGLPASGIPGDAFTGETVRPFDRDATGMGVGTATVALLLERRADAESKGRTIAARVLGGAAVGTGRPRGLLPTDVATWRACHARALGDAGVTPEDVDVVVAAAPGMTEMDLAEATALASGIGRRPAIVSVKGAFGECRGADGAVGVLVAACTFATQTVPPTVGLAVPLDVAGLQFQMPPGDRRSLRTCLVDTASPGGNYASLVLGAP